ncbi:MAG: hypothetical protein ABW252_21965 [Polyangiales bacterium]
MTHRRQVLLALSMIVASACADERAANSSDPLAQLADAGAAAPTSPLSGTQAASQCMSYTQASADAGTCAGYYCGVTEAEIAAALPADSLCPHAAELCSGTISGAVRKCTTTIVIANLGQPVEPLVPQIRECIAQDPDLKAAGIGAACLDCYVPAATCAAANCLLDCVTPTPACDACRAKNKCDVPVFGCANTPSPF